MRAAPAAPLPRGEGAGTESAFSPRDGASDEAPETRQRRRGCRFRAPSRRGRSAPLSRPAARRSFLVTPSRTRGRGARSPSWGPPRGGGEGARVGSSSSAAAAVCVPGQLPAPPPGRPASASAAAEPRPGAAPEPKPTTRARLARAPARQGLGSAAQLPAPAFSPLMRRAARARKGLAAATSSKRLAGDPGAVNGFAGFPFFRVGARWVSLLPCLFFHLATAT